MPTNTDEDKNILQLIGEHQFKFIPRKIKFKKYSINTFAILFFITLGIALLLNVTKALAWDIWGILWRLWPVFLLMAILQIFSKKSKIINLLVLSLGIGLLISIVFFSVSSVSNTLEVWLNQLRPNLTNIRKFLGIELGDRLTSQLIITEKAYALPEKRIVKIKIGAGETSIKDDSSSNYFSAKSYYYENYGKPELESYTDVTNLNINFETVQNVKTLFGSTEDIKYEIILGQPTVASQLDINMGPGSLYAKFEKTVLDSLIIKVGAGTANVEVSETSLPQEKIEIVVGAGNLNLKLPFKTFAKINYSVGLGKLEVNTTSLRRTGSYTTPNFRITEAALPIDVKLGAGKITITTSGED